MLKGFKYANDVLSLGLDSNQDNSDKQSKLDILKGLPFYCWNTTKFGFDTCCFNHGIGLPTNKKGIEMPLFDYERTIYDAFQEHKHIWILKATGLGLSELTLRYIGWLCTKDNRLYGSHMIIVTGPRIDLAVTLVERLKQLFYNQLEIIFSNKETVLDLNGVHIEAYPSHHLDSARGLPKVSMVYLDEADFFPKNQQEDARKVSERYIAKSSPYIIMTSTANAPGGLFETMLKEKKSIYHRIVMDYTYGLNKIYTKAQIAEQMKSRSFKQEYCCQFLGTIGNLFTPRQIDDIVTLGEQYKDIPISQYTLKAVACDFGFSSSATGIVMVESITTEDNRDRKLIVRYSKAIEKGDPNAIADLLWDFHVRYNNVYYFVDGSNRAMVNLLKIKFGESLLWDSKDARMQAQTK
jgi:hypothetical protein